MTSLESEFTFARGRTDSDQDIDGFAAPEITAQEFAEHTAQQTAGAFAATRLFEVVEVKASIGQVHLLGRVKSDHEVAFVDKIITPTLRAIDKSKDCEGHICKQFLLKNDRTKYAWTVSFAANDLRAAAHAICSAIEPAIPRVEVMESPLVGGSTPEGSVGKGGRKGAAPVR